MLSHEQHKVVAVDSENKWLTFATDSLKDADLEAEGYTDLPAAVEALEGQDQRSTTLALVSVELVDTSEELFRNLCRNHCVVVMFSSSLTPVNMSRLFRLGAYDCIDKPYGHDCILAVVRSLLEELELKDFVSRNALSCSLPVL